MKIIADLFQPILYQSSVEFTKFMQEAFGDGGKLIEDPNITID